MGARGRRHRFGRGDIYCRGIAVIVYSSASRLRQAAATKETSSAAQVRKRRDVGVDKNPYDTLERDRLMREMCRAGSTTVEIAEALGYSTPAAASRRMRQLGLIAAKGGKL